VPGTSEQVYRKYGGNITEILCKFLLSILLRTEKSLNIPEKFKIARHRFKKKIRKIEKKRKFLDQKTLRRCLE
jgi:hypothetical protein